MQRLVLNNGSAVPRVGLGVWPLTDDQAYTAVTHALEAGYRRIDTAQVYRNEEGVGRAVRDVGIPRPEVFLTTKLGNADQGYDRTLRAFDASVRSLGTDYVDLYLIHWPLPGRTGTSSRTGPWSGCTPRGAPGRSASPTSPPRRSDGCWRRPASSRPSTRSSCTPTSPRSGCARSPPGVPSPPRRGARSPRAAGCSPSPPSPGSPTGTGRHRPRWSSAGTSSSATW